MKKLLLSLFILFISSSTSYSEDITKTRTIEQFFKEKTELRVATGAIESYKDSLNEISTQVIKRAEELANKDNRKTIMERDIDQATEEVFRQAPMTIAELMEKIKLLSIIDLAELANQVDTYAEELKKTQK